LGGQDFDTNLLDHFKKEFTKKTKKVRQNPAGFAIVLFAEY
jgi:L1 cell adhesion molecule like protein